MEFINKHPATVLISLLMIVGTMEDLQDDHDIKAISYVLSAIVNGFILGVLIDSHEGFKRCIPLLTLIVVFSQYAVEPPAKIEATLRQTVGSMLVTNIMSFLLLNIF